MLTDDSETTARRIAGRLGIDNGHPDVLPGDKTAKVPKLQAAGGGPPSGHVPPPAPLGPATWPSPWRDATVA